MTLALCSTAEAEVLGVPEVLQEQTNWCWAATSAAVISYYGPAVEQCEVAEYTRQVATWRDFGNSDCCVDATKGCNQETWSEYPEGSVLDILAHWGIAAEVVLGPITKEQAQQALDAGRPFILHWTTPIIGHFIVAIGLEGDALSYLDPLVGFQTADFSWVLSAENEHVWDETMVMLTVPSCVDQADDTLCTDANLCTRTDRCVAGVCEGSDPVSCEAGAVCTETSCNEASGVCETRAAEDGQSCDDGDLCTEQDSCQQGACVGEQLSCPNDDDPCQSSSCDGASGQCVAAPEPDGTPCDDANACTLTDRCSAGVCVGEQQRVCDDGDDCTSEVCDEQTGGCEVVGNACEEEPTKKEEQQRSDDEGGGCHLGRKPPSIGTPLLLLSLILLGWRRRRYG